MKGIKTGGRQAGTPNKLTKELRDVLNTLLQTELEALPERLQQLDTKDRLEIVMKLLPYILPKMEQVELTGIGDTDVIQVTFNTAPNQEIADQINKRMAELKALNGETISETP